MGRTGLLAFACGAAIAACAVHAEPAPGPEASVLPAHRAAPGEAREPELTEGDYACSITGYRPFPCVVYRARHGALELEKLGGSQRIRGRARPTASGFDFEGVFFCPYGSCTTAVRASFAAQPDGSFRGTLEGDLAGPPVEITLRHLPDGHATTYGGQAYGYGGRAYARPVPR